MIAPGTCNVSSVIKRLYLLAVIFGAVNWAYSAVPGHVPDNKRVWRPTLRRWRLLYGGGVTLWFCFIGRQNAASKVCHGPVHEKPTIANNVQSGSEAIRWCVAQPIECSMWEAWEPTTQYDGGQCLVHTMRILDNFFYVCSSKMNSLLELWKCLLDRIQLPVLYRGVVLSFCNARSLSFPLTERQSDLFT